MEPRTDTLRREIEHTRADMGETIEAIGDRLSPTRVLERRKLKTRDAVSSLRERVMGTAEDVQHGVASFAHDAGDSIEHAPEMVKARTQGAPLVAGAIAAGTGFLIAAMFPASDAERRASASIMDAVEPARQEVVEGAKAVAEHLKEPIAAAAADLQQTVKDGAGEVAATAREATQGASPTPPPPNLIG